MIFNVLTIFPDMFLGILSNSILKRAIEKNIIRVNLIDIRKYSYDKHKKTDDYPYGGGYGMVMMVQPIYEAIRAISKKNNIPIYYMGPRGKVFNQKKAIELSKQKEIILLCGHYEGIDERIYTLVDEEISLGDFIMTGGEIAAMAVIDATSRMVHGVLPHDESFINDSFYHNLLEYPQYTRPEMFENMNVPKILLSGNHAEIAKWRRNKSLLITAKFRPDLIEKKNLSDDDIKYLKSYGYDI